MEPDYYIILGVRADATEDEIKKGYWKVAKRYHPDANPGNQEAEQKFKVAAEAYAVLSDPEKRKDYDKERFYAHGAGSEKMRRDKKKKNSQKTTSFDFSSTSSDFEQFFGFQPGTSQVNGDKLNPNKKTETNPIDMTEMFKRYMGIK